jgi:hypothetical protein
MAQTFFVALLGLVLSFVTGSAFAWLAFEYCVGRLMQRMKRDASRRVSLSDREVYRSAEPRLPLVPAWSRQTLQNNVFNNPR